jgi:hypothetical protein
VTLAVLLSPRRFAEWALRSGTFPQALVLIAVAMAFSIVGAYRLATTIRVEDLVFGPTRSSVIDALIGAIGVERTTVLVYMLERSFDVLVVASAITPLFLWLLGSSAMHAAARIRGVRGHAYLPMIVLFAYAEAGYQVPTSTAGILFGAFGSGLGPQLASAVSVIALAWFALVVYRGVESYYGVSGDRAIAIFLLGAIVFYIVPLILIVAALIAIVLAASLLEYF